MFQGENGIALNHPDIFKGLENLTNLVACCCFLDEPFVSNIFIYRESLVEIDLFRVHIIAFHASLFNGLRNLETLDMIECGIKTIEPNSFVGLTRLKKLSLGFNSSANFDTDTF